MKVKFTLIIVLLYNTVVTQNKKWSFYDLDSIAYLQMPFDVYEIDTIINYNKAYQIYSENDSTKFIVQKLFLGKLYSNIQSPTLPTNEKSLNTFYLEIIDALNQIIDYDFVSKKKIINNDLVGYQTFYKNTENIKVFESHFFYINKNLYTFSYINENGLKENDRIQFFNSITFNDDVDLLQYPIKKISLYRKIIFSLFGFLLLTFLLRLKSKRKNTS